MLPVAAIKVKGRVGRRIARYLQEARIGSAHNRVKGLTHIVENMVHDDLVNLLREAGKTEDVRRTMLLLSAHLLYRYPMLQRNEPEKMKIIRDNTRVLLDRFLYQFAKDRKGEVMDVVKSLLYPRYRDKEAKERNLIISDESYRQNIRENYLKIVGSLLKASQHSKDDLEKALARIRKDPEMITRLLLLGKNA